MYLIKFQRNRYFYIAIVTCSSMAISLYLLFFSNETNNLNRNYNEKPNFLAVINNSRRDGSITKAISFDFQDCHLTWVEKKEWPQEKLCVADYQVLKSAFSINLSMIDSDTGITVRKITASNSNVIDISPKVSLGLAPTPEFKNTNVSVNTALEAFDLLKSDQNALKTYTQMCGVQSRVSYSKSLLLFTKPNMTDELVNIIKNYAKQCD